MVELRAGLACVSEAGVPGSELLAVLAPELWLVAASEWPEP